MISKIAVIGDIHIGIPQTERLYEELQYFVHWLEDTDVTILVINGDYFDRKLLLNESSTLKAMQFFVQLMEICEKKQIKVRLIEGTMTHDMMQGVILEEIASGYNVDFKFIKTCGTEKLDGLDVLYIPEEYPLNAEEFYAPFRFDEAGNPIQYDVIFVHGMLDSSGLSQLENKANKTTENSAPFFITKEWVKHLEHGVCMASHYHARQSTKDGKFVYIGSYSAWNFVQPSEKGWGYLISDSDKHEYSYTLPVNPYAPKYIDIQFSELGLDVMNSSVDEIVLAINKKAEDEKIDYFKIFVRDLPIDKLELLKKTYAGNKHIIIEQKDSKLLQESAEAEEENTRYEYILNDSMTLPQTIQKFIEEEYGKKISIEKINAIITSEE